MPRVFAIDVLECLRCGGGLRILAAIQFPDAIRKIPDCLGLPFRGDLQCLVSKQNWNGLEILSPGGRSRPRNNISLGQRPFLSITFRDDGAWRTPVARPLWEQEVGGSNPLAPIILIKKIGRLMAAFFFDSRSRCNGKCNNRQLLGNCSELASNKKEGEVPVGVLLCSLSGVGVGGGEDGLDPYHERACFGGVASTSSLRPAGARSPDRDRSTNLKNCTYTSLVSCGSSDRRCYPVQSRLSLAVCEERVSLYPGTEPARVHIGCRFCCFQGMTRRTRPTGVRRGVRSAKCRLRAEGLKW